jgi:hypothetical protein
MQADTVRRIFAHLGSGAADKFFEHESRGRTRCNAAVEGLLAAGTASLAPVRLESRATAVPR